MLGALASDLRHCYDIAMRILAIDFGTRRIGLALSDALGITAQPLETLQRHSQKADLARLRELVEECGVSLVIVGLPRNLDGSPGALWDEVERFREMLRKELSCPVEGWDERLSTAEAERILISADVSRRKRRKVVDKIAAALILQSYLEARSKAESSSGF